MNTILHKLKIAVIFGYTYRKGKTIWYILLLCDDLTFNYYGTLYYELLYAHCIKEKERSTGKISIIIIVGSIIQKILIR